MPFVRLDEAFCKIGYQLVLKKTLFLSEDRAKNKKQKHSQ
jgi:hypothetical protein